MTSLPPSLSPLVSMKWLSIRPFQPHPPLPARDSTAVHLHAQGGQGHTRRSRQALYVCLSPPPLSLPSSPPLHQTALPPLPSTPPHAAAAP
uniref:Uncharacterized protein n=1 Tax=Tetraselmis sp. GSL018 TaxID=582737 RepID=A0A061RBB4_9CHLO